MKIEICFSPFLYPAYKEDNTIVVVVDVFRATTTMCAALANGAASVIPVRTLEEAREYKDKGFLVGGERNVKKFEFGDFGNSPSEYTADKVEGKDIVISTTNGTRAIDAATDSFALLIGAFSNLSAIAEFCAVEKKGVLVLCAGWKDKVNFEDTLFGGALAYKLKEKGFDVNFDSTQIALSMWNEAKDDIWKYIQRSEHIKRLEAHDLLDVAKYCLQIDTMPVLPVYDRQTKHITDRKKDYDRII